MSKNVKRKNGAARNRLPLPLLLVFGGALLIAGALYAVWQAGQPDQATVPVDTSGAARLQVDQEVIDLGDVPVDQMVDVTFKIANTGDQTLRISEQPVVRVVEGCWPPTATIGSMVLKPGEQTTLSMSFTMHAGMEGAHDFRVNLVSNDASQPAKELVILSNWVPK